MTREVVVFGSSGFVGEAVCSALSARGAAASKRSAPRLNGARPAEARSRVASHAHLIRDLATSLPPGSVVINAAGVAEASSYDEAKLTGANTIMPAVIASACAVADVQRLVHVSSAAVQGRRFVLDDGPTAPFSPYSRSKALAEALVRDAFDRSVVYRPPGVHGEARAVTRSIARLARSPWSSVADPIANTPQTLVSNAGDAIAFLALTDRQPPAIVSHPTEGITTRELLLLLGGHEPRCLPQPLARLLVSGLLSGGFLTQQLPVNGRRLELLWFGQNQAHSWLTSAGWTPSAGREEWRQLAARLSYL